jgi:hypothetical protein
MEGFAYYVLLPMLLAEALLITLVCGLVVSAIAYWRTREWSVTLVVTIAVTVTVFCLSCCVLWSTTP